ncbi:MAG TPA: hypothetical protein VF456_00830 [Vicinamibacterales bacterium]
MTQLFPAERIAELNERSPLCIASRDAVGGGEPIGVSVQVKPPFVFHLTIESPSGKKRSGNGPVAWKPSHERPRV